jgi:hypothetical protein
VLGCYPWRGKTMPDIVPWLIGLFLAALVGFLSWVDRRSPGR